MFGFTALLGVLANWAVLVLMALLIWLLRDRGVKVILALVAYGLLLLLNADTFVHTVTGAMIYPEDPGGALMQAIRSLGWYRFEINAFAAVATLVLLVPWPKARGLRILAIATLIGFALTLLATFAFSGLDMR